MAAGAPPVAAVAAAAPSALFAAIEAFDTVGYTADNQGTVAVGYHRIDPPTHPPKYPAAADNLAPMVLAVH